MGFGVLEDHKTDHVPGTVILDEEAGHTEITTGGLKHATGKNSHIVLVPQPSEDPNDPLNWSLWQREMTFFVLNLGAVLCSAVVIPVLNPATVVLATYFDRSITDIIVANSYSQLATACIGPFACAFSRKVGKRPVFFFSVIFAVVGTAVCEAATTYNTLLAGRLIQGFSTSAFESLLAAVIGDLYFVHQRGHRVAFFNFINVVAANITTLISGPLVNSVGWKWVFHILQIFLVILLVLTFLFCPETTYIRDQRYDTDTIQIDALEELVATEKRAREPTSELSATESGTSRTEIPRKKTFFQSLAIFTGVYSKDNIIKLVIAPFVALLNPAALYTIVTSGMLQAWYVALAITQAGLFSAPPYLLNAAQLGYLSVGPLVGGLLGSFVIGLVSDPVVKWASAKNKGIYEPEFRLLSLCIGAPLYAGGMFGYAWAVQYGESVYLCNFLYGMMLAGGVIASTTVIVYALDAYRESSNEIFIMNMLYKNFFYFGMSHFVVSWVDDAGAGSMFSVLAGTGLGLCMLGGVIYMYGKILRSFWARHNLLVLWHLTSSDAPLMNA